MKTMVRGTIFGLIVMAFVSACQKQGNDNGRYTRKARGTEGIGGPAAVGGQGATVPPDSPQQAGVFPGGGGTPPLPGGGGTQPPIQMTTFWGVITPQAGSVQYGNQNYSASSNDITRWFLITHLRPKEVGATTAENDMTYQMNCVNPNACGIIVSAGRDEGQRQPLRFMNNMTLNQVMQSQSRSPIVDGGNLTVGIFDSLVGSISNETGKPVESIRVVIGIDPASYVQGNRFYLQFNDTFGSVTMDGTIQGNISTGQIKFYHINDINNTQTQAQGTLGSFQINTCAMFRCQ